jgi:hypothetical protein
MRLESAAAKAANESQGAESPGSDGGRPDEQRPVRRAATAARGAITAELAAGVGGGADGAGSDDVACDEAAQQS